MDVDEEEHSVSGDSKEPPPRKSVKEIVHAIKLQMKELFTMPQINKTVLCSSIYFANFFGYVKRFNCPLPPKKILNLLMERSKRSSFSVNQNTNRHAWVVRVVNLSEVFW